MPQHGVTSVAPNISAHAVTREMRPCDRSIRPVVEMGSPRLDGWYAQKGRIQLAERLDGLESTPVGVIHHQAELPPRYVGNRTVVVNQVVERRPFVRPTGPDRLLRLGAQHSVKTHIQKVLKGQCVGKRERAEIEERRNGIVKRYCSQLGYRSAESRCAARGRIRLRCPLACLKMPAAPLDRSGGVKGPAGVAAPAGPSVWFITTCRPPTCISAPPRPAHNPMITSRLVILRTRLRRAVGVNLLCPAFSINTV